MVALYATPSPTVITPSGEIAGSNAEIAVFWRKQLKTEKVHANFKLLSAHFNDFAGHKQEHVLIARYAVNTDERNQSPLNSGKQPLWHVDAILKQEANGQWKIQLQHWY